MCTCIIGDLGSSSVLTCRIYYHSFVSVIMCIFDAASLTVTGWTAKQVAQTHSDPSQSDTDAFSSIRGGGSGFARPLNLAESGAIYNKDRFNYSSPLDLFWHKLSTLWTDLGPNSQWASSRVALCVHTHKYILDYGQAVVFFVVVVFYFAK